MARLLYMVLEYFTGQRDGPRLIPYKVGQRVKMFLLMFLI